MDRYTSHHDTFRFPRRPRPRRLTDHRHRRAERLRAAAGTAALARGCRRSPVRRHRLDADHPRGAGVRCARHPVPRAHGRGGLGRGGVPRGLRSAGVPLGDQSGRAACRDPRRARDGQTLAAVLGTTLAVSLLNPHVYLDTVVLLGGVAAQYAPPERVAFVLGAGVASSVWFFGLALGARLLTPIFERPVAWRVLDVIIGCIMWSIAPHWCGASWGRLSMPDFGISAHAMAASAPPVALAASAAGSVMSGTSPPRTDPRYRSSPKRSKPVTLTASVDARGDALEQLIGGQLGVAGHHHHVACRVGDAVRRADREDPDVAPHIGDRPVEAAVRLAVLPVHRADHVVGDSSGERPGNVVVVEGVDHDDVVGLGAVAEERTAVVDEDADALVVRQCEVLAGDLDHLLVELDRVDAERRVVAPHALHERAPAKPDDQRRGRIRLDGQREVQVVHVLDVGLERVVERHRRLLVALELELAPGAVLGDAEAVKG